MKKKLAVLVEDNPSIQKLIQAYLERLGMEVVSVADGQTGLAEIERHQPALVVLDLMLPRVSGYEVCEQMRSRLGLTDIPVLVVSARTAPQDRAHAEEVGADAYLTKPFKEAVFVAEVQRLLGAYAGRQKAVMA